VRRDHKRRAANEELLQGPLGLSLAFALLLQRVFGLKGLLNNKFGRLWSDGLVAALLPIVAVPPRVRLLTAPSITGPSDPSLGYLLFNKPCKTPG
jgi:hypothetical protein